LGEKYKCAFYNIRCHAFGEHDRQPLEAGDVVVFADEDLPAVEALGVQGPAAVAIEIGDVDLGAGGVVEAVDVAAVDGEKGGDAVFVVEPLGKRAGGRIDHVGVGQEKQPDRPVDDLMLLGLFHGASDGGGRAAGAHGRMDVNI